MTTSLRDNTPNPSKSALGSVLVRRTSRRRVRAGHGRVSRSASSCLISTSPGWLSAEVRMIVRCSVRRVERMPVAVSRTRRAQWVPWSSSPASRWRVASWATTRDHARRGAGWTELLGLCERLGVGAPDRHQRQSQIAAALDSAGLPPDSSSYRYRALHQRPLFAKNANPCPNAEALASSTFQPPAHPSLPEEPYSGWLHALPLGRLVGGSPKSIVGRHVISASVLRFPRPSSGEGG
jgi:hypothetical protein